MRNQPGLLAAATAGSKARQSSGANRAGLTGAGVKDDGLIHGVRGRGAAIIAVQAGTVLELVSHAIVLVPALHACPKGILKPCGKRWRAPRQPGRGMGYDAHRMRSWHEDCQRASKCLQGRKAQSQNQAPVQCASCTLTASPAPAPLKIPMVPSHSTIASPMTRRCGIFPTRCQLAAWPAVSCTHPAGRRGSHSLG